MNLLDVRNLKIKFCSRGIETEAVKSISFSLRENESVAIVGESGSGKTVTAMSLTKLLPPPPTCTVEGDIIFDGKNIAPSSITPSQ